MPSIPDMNGCGKPLGLPAERFLPLDSSRHTSALMKLKRAGRMAGGADGTQPTDAARLMEAARDFEAVFLSQVLKQMRGTIEKEELFHGGMGEDFFTEMMDEELAKRIASRQSTGIAEMLYRQLSRQFGIENTPKVTGGEGNGLPGPTVAADSLRNQLRAVQAQMKAAPNRPSAPEF
jgi:flagellar protein FlgJ